MPGLIPGTTRCVIIQVMKVVPPNDIPKWPQLSAGPGTPQRQNNLRIGKTSSRTRRADVGYERSRDLPRLIALWPRETRDNSPEGVLRIIAKLRQAMRAERRRGLASHRSYDIERHLLLVKAVKREIASLEGRRIPSLP